MSESPIFLMLLWTVAMAFVWTYHRLQEVNDISEVPPLPKWARIISQELKRESSGFSRRPSKIWRKTLGVMFAAMLVFYLVLDPTPLTMRLGIGAICTLTFAAWAYYLDKLMIRV